MGDVATDEELPRSEYELQTQGNIAQNKQKLQQLGLDKPAIQTNAKAKAKGKAKTPSAAAAASTTVVLRGRPAAAAEPKETGKKRKNDEPQREAEQAVLNLGRRRLDSLERASRSLRQRASPSHTTCSRRRRRIQRGTRERSDQASRRKSPRPSRTRTCRISVMLGT